MNIKKIVKLAIVLASLIALSQTGLPSAIAAALTPAAVGSTATIAQAAKNADAATTAATAPTAPTEPSKTTTPTR
ncbi:hypothetical protein ME790_08560 [Lactobacillus delbrueckii]|uniref:hypothetical protein n=1 Tax=Lactobacillus delbrueckii TaxID=1584 RepID=UPI001F23C963|nr:hypothetical protein [Lactobacillus delbrueckii]GHN31785.1 hypothetical protein ME790_08560 [Lactobacillus delbrueckii]